MLFKEQNKTKSLRKEAYQHQICKEEQAKVPPTIIELSKTLLLLKVTPVNDLSCIKVPVS